jgi:hypothetical protein
MMKKLFNLSRVFLSNIIQVRYSFFGGYSGIIAKAEVLKKYNEVIAKTLKPKDEEINSIINKKINNSIDSFSNLIKFCREDFSSLGIEPKFYEFLFDEVENRLAKSGYSVTRYYGLGFDIIVNIKD